LSFPRRREDAAISRLAQILGGCQITTVPSCGPTSEPRGDRRRIAPGGDRRCPAEVRPSRSPKPDPKKKRRFRAVASRALFFSGCVGFGPVGSVRVEDLREALRGRKSLQSRPPAEEDRRVGIMEQWNIGTMGWGIGRLAQYSNIPVFQYSTTPS